MKSHENVVVFLRAPSNNGTSNTPSIQRVLFVALCITALLTESQAFTASQSRVTTRWSTSLAASASTNENSKQSPPAASKRNQQKRRPPPGKQRYKEKYDKNMAQAIAFNKKLVTCESTDEILTLLASTPNALTKMAGGGALNNVNFSTALHRMARFCSYNQQTRKKTLMDPRFALFLCSLTEAMAGMDPTVSLSDYQADTNKKKKTSLVFSPREFSNIAWSIAKIRIAPPQSTLPIQLTDDSTELVETSLKCRSQVLQGAREGQKLWIPTLSLLSGKILDAVSYMSNKTTGPFNSQEMANLLWAMATAQRADSDVFNHISSSLVKNMNAEAKPQELSNSIWAYGTSGMHGKGQELLLKYTADALTKNKSFIEKWKCQECSNNAWGIATILSNKSQRTPEEEANALTILRKVAVAITQRADDFKTQELANTVWAMATVGFGLDGASANSLNEYIYLKSDDLDGDHHLMEQALHAVQKSAIPRLREFRSQELNNMVWSYARLGRTESNELYEGVGRELGRRHRDMMDGQDIFTTLWGFATASYFNEEVYRLVLSRIDLNKIQTYRPQEFSTGVWALATAGIPTKYPDAFDTTLVPEELRPSDWKEDPVTVCFAVAANELMRRPHEFKSQEVKDILWGFSKEGIRHPQLFKSVAEYLVGKETDKVPTGQLHCGKGLDNHTPQSIGNLLWSYAKQAQLAAETVNRLGGISSFATGRLLVSSTICMDLGESLTKRLFKCGAETDLDKFDDLNMLSQQDLSNTAWSFSAIGLRHSRFFDALSRQVVRRMSQDNSGENGGFKGQEVANICWACSNLNFRFPEMLDAISNYMCQLCERPDGTYNARSIAAKSIRQECANIAWSCAVVGHYPPELMDLLYTGLVGKGDERNAEYMSHVFGDGGLQPQAVMSLLYVQVAIDMEWPENDLALPENFPDGWYQKSDDNTADSEMRMLSLSTSRIQSAVSNAFDRIGFVHTEEHVIAMDELVCNHGIQLSSKPSFQVLSIDIADVPNKIAIEVDGPGHYCSVLDTWSPQEEPRGSTVLVNGKMEYQFQWDYRQELNGSTALKDRLLKGLGWKVLHVPFYEWHAISGNTAKEDEYCRELLRQV